MSGHSKKYFCHFSSSYSLPPGWLEIRPPKRRTHFRATLNNVRFVRCTFNGSGLDLLKASSIEVVDSKVISTSMSEGQLIGDTPYRSLDHLLQDW